MTVVDIELVVPVGDGVVFVPLPNGPFVPLNVGTELPESLGDDVLEPLLVDTELSEFCRRRRCTYVGWRGHRAARVPRERCTSAAGCRHIAA
jgi:hypothetical protein